MKKFYGFLSVLMLSFCFTQSSAQCISATPCFTDGFGYVYKFSNAQVTGVNVYVAEGTCTAYPSSTATMKLDLTDGINNGTVKIVVRNAAADGCFSFSDSFIYVGTAQLIKGSDKIVTSYSGSGTWQSYCYGGVINAGTWSAWGPCGSSGSTLKQSTGLAPIDGKQKIADYKKGIVASPNPTNTTTTLSYSVKDAGKVNVTIYNSMNQPVKVLVNEVKAVGSYTVQWNLLNSNNVKVSAGVYRAVLTTGASSLSSNIQVLGN